MNTEELPDLRDLMSGLRNGQVDLLKYLEVLEARFEKIEPMLQSFLPEEGRWERLQTEARDLLKAFPPPGNRPSLFGLVVGIKDIFHVDGFETRAGSRLPPQVLAGGEAKSVQQLKAAGALILGKTVTTEFAYFAPGPTRNPNHPDHTPGGSSSGSAAAAKAGLAPLTLGTQTIGSIIRPAAFCGVVGYKPTYERISRNGVIPLSPSLDHIGIFTADLPGVSLIAEVLCDGWSTGTEVPQPVLGIPAGEYLERASGEGWSHFDQVCRDLEEAGFLIRTVPMLENFSEIEARHNRILAAEAAAVHTEWFQEYPQLYHQRTAEMIRAGQHISHADLQQDLAGRAQFREKLTGLMDATGVDIWITPAAPGPAPAGLDSTGDPVMNLPWTQAGFPAINLPSGLASNHLPLGLQLVGRPLDDERLFSWAEQLNAGLQKSGS